jgi:hypothetical protein
MLTSCWQTSRDLVEEWIAARCPPLCSYYWFKNIVEKEGYLGPTLNSQRLMNFLNDPTFVNNVEHEVKKICGPYGKKEEKAKLHIVWKSSIELGAMRIAYPERTLSPNELAPDAKTSKGKRSV